MDTEDEGRLAAAIAAELRAARGRSGLSRTEVSRRTGISLASLNRYELGKRPIPIPELYDFCRTVGGSPAEIMSAAQRVFYDGGPRS